MRADIRARLRSEKSLARKPGHREPRALILIVCEDEKSSPAYFKDVRVRLRLTTAEVEIYGKECGSAPINVVEFAIQQAKTRADEDRKPDRTFCVVDVDQHTTLNQATALAREKACEMIVSCPCFERWYLLHFERGDRPYDRFDQLVPVLKKYLPGYDKGDFCDFDRLWERLDVALNNARRLRRSRGDDPEQNAFTDVDLLLGVLRGIAAG